PTAEVKLAHPGKKRIPACDGIVSASAGSPSVIAGRERNPKRTKKRRPRGSFARRPSSEGRRSAFQKHIAAPVDIGDQRSGVRSHAAVDWPGQKDPFEPRQTL